jgi:MFS family permease
VAEPIARSGPHPLQTRPASHSPFVALQHRDFRIYWFGQFISTCGSTMQIAGVGWQVYLLSHSAIALGALGLVRVLPLLVFSLGGGVFADTFSRRHLMLVTQSALLLTSLGLALTTLGGTATLWVVYALTAAGTSALAFDQPARQALVPSLVPREHLTNAMSINSTAWQTANVIGPGLAGVIIAASSVATVYVFDAVSFLAVLAALLVINPPPTAGAEPRISIHAAVDGLRFVFRTPILRSTMLLDFVATFFGSAVILLPIFARDILHVGAVGYGVLFAADSLGAIVAGVVMTLFGGRIRRQGLVIISAVMAYSACTVLFGLSHVYALSILALAGVGASDTVSMILRQTVRQMVTPDALRGRMTSVQMVFFMGGPQLGNLEAGVVARVAGAPISVVTGGLAALAATALIAYRGVSLRRYERTP